MITCSECHELFDPGYCGYCPNCGQYPNPSDHADGVPSGSFEEDDRLE